jgi:hypothetical protein
MKAFSFCCPKQYSFLRSQWGWHGYMIYLACTSILHIPRPTFGGGDAGNKHLEVATWCSNQQGVYFNCG